MSFESRRAQLIQLKDGWDGGVAPPITGAALRFLDATNLVPTCNGGIQLEWHLNDWDLEIEIGPNGDPTSVLWERTQP